MVKEERSLRTRLAAGSKRRIARRVRQAANLLRGRTIGCLPVLEDGKLVGILTTTDLLEQIGRGSDRPAKGKRWVMKGRGPRRKALAVAR